MIGAAVESDATVRTARTRASARAGAGSDRPARARALILLTVVGLTAASARATAQDYWAVPELLGGRLTVAGDASASMAPVDTGYFNDTDYGHNTLRMLAAGATLSMALAPRLAILAEGRVENVDTVRTGALYLRTRPWASVPLDIQAGLIPPVFGGFARRRYGNDNPLVGTPLAYQYLTTLRPDVVPANADALLGVRGRGWRVPDDPPPGTDYPSAGARAGVPLVSAFRWDTGVQARVASRAVELAVAVTQGTLSDPHLRDTNGGKQVSARLAWAPVPALKVGVSGARGEFFADAALDRAKVTHGARTDQRALGADADLSGGHWLVRAEVVASWWHVPAVSAPEITAPLRAVGMSVEARYRLRPRLYVAARGDHLGFSRIRGTLFGGNPTTWDANVRRFETGGGYTITRQLLLKLIYQHDVRDTVRFGHANLAAAQLALWF